MDAEDIMKKPLLIVFLSMFLFSMVLLSNTVSVVPFEKYFSNHTMRIDYFHTGDKAQEFFSIDQIYKQGQWAGNPDSLIDPFNNGQYYIKIYDLTSNILIYSKGFNSYFGEYQTTDKAAKGIKRTYHETALIPFPNKKIRFVVEKRDRKNNLNPVFDYEIAPKSIEINTESLISGVEVFKMVDNGDPHHKVDLAFIAEGYTIKEKDTLKKHLQEAVTILFSQEPYKSNKEKFNVYGVFKPSKDSGCDEPTYGRYKNTSVDSSFNSLGLNRYLLTEGNRKLQDIAAHVPFDALIIMVNHQRYGGGGIYNSYCVFTAESSSNDYLLVHEFGHSFAGLGDEYYTSTVAYNDFYPKGIEPPEPNITALLDPSNLKWKKFVTKGIDIPTGWGKESYDILSIEYQKLRQNLNNKIAKMEREKAPKAEILKLKKELDRLSDNNRGKTRAFIKSNKMKGKVGAFEGAGYSSKGLFRPMVDCVMFSSGMKPYCKVCEAAVLKMVIHYTLYRKH
jgi:hypothetical protein